MLNYDLGLKGDYQNLYRFLDNQRAIDCGNCNAALEIEVSNDDFETVLHEVSEFIKKNISLSTTDRLYISTTDSSGLMRGKFISGNRKRAIWEGYGDIPTTKDEIF